MMARTRFFDYHSTNTGAYEAGKLDYQSNQPHCPFEEGDPLAREWMRGVEDARAERLLKILSANTSFSGSVLK